ncbi:MAG: TRAP transporter fused permease subunit, partial [Alphaproteobacteria bacterium]
MADTDRETGGLSQAEIDQMVASADTGGRSAGAFVAKLIAGIALAWSLFQLWFASPLPFAFGFGVFNDTEARSIHLAFSLVLAFLAFPPEDTPVQRILGIAAPAILGGLLALSAGDTFPAWIVLVIMAAVVVGCALPTRPDRVAIQEWIMAAAAGFCAAYLFLFYRELADRVGQPIDIDFIVSIAGLLLLLEATRRALGPALVIVASFFLLYTVLGPYMPEIVAPKGNNLREIINHHWITTEGVFGIALGVSTSFVFLFVLFGALLDKAGAGNYFIQVAFSLMGHMKGGPAKAAVVSSAMTGLISGSSIANVVTTGTFTIPLMKKVGFSAEKAGAVEVASSVNGQIMPPVMGAAAFLMVEYVGIPYFDVVTHAFLPAVISYIALVYIVHLEAAKAGMEGLPRPYTPGPLLRRLVGFVFGVVVLCAVSLAVYYGMGWIRPAFGEAAMIVVFLFLTAVYVALVAFGSNYPEPKMDDPNAPVIVTLGQENGLLVPLIAVHLFVFYFGIMADVTPPVGLASFAAAAVSGGDPIKTGFVAFFYSLRTAALPFLFIFNTDLLLIDVSVIEG